MGEQVQAATALETELTRLGNGIALLAEQAADSHQRIGTLETGQGNLSSRLAALEALHPDDGGETDLDPIPEPNAQGELMVSTMATRVPAQQLAVVPQLSNTVYVFWRTFAGKATPGRVTFKLTGPGGVTEHTENTFQFDFAGTTSSGAAAPFNTKAFDNGDYELEARVFDTSLVEVDRQVVSFTIFNTSTPPPTDGGRDFPNREPMRLVNQRDLIVTPFRVPETPGDWALEVIGCTNIQFPDGFELNGGGVKIEGSSGIRAGKALINRNKLGRSGWSDEEVGWRVRYSTDVELSDSVVAYADCLLRAEASERITFRRNFTYNPRGPMPRGQHFQAWQFENKRVKDLLFDGHYALTDFYAPGKAPGGESLWVEQEDAMNVSAVDGAKFLNGFHEMRGAELSPRVSGTGFITEQGSTGVEIRHYAFVGQANHGWSISGGAQAYLEDVVSFFDGIGGAVGSGKTAGVVRQGAQVTFGPGVRCYGTKSATDPWGAFWLEPGTPAPANYSSLVTGTYESAAAQAELAALVRPPIPDVGFVLPARS